MTCERAGEQILDSLAGAVAPADRQALERHLAECAECAALRSGYARIWEDLPEAAALPEAAHGLAALEARAAAELGEAWAGAAAAGGGDRRRAGGVWRQAVAAAAVLAVGLVAGVTLERSRTPAGVEATPTPEATPDDAPRFLLLLYTPSGQSEQTLEASAEIGEWARRLFREGVVEEGGGLAAARAWGAPLPAGRDGDRSISHFIRIRAADLEEARRIAATLPLIERGGLVEVRPIE